MIRTRDRLNAFLDLSANRLFRMRNPARSPG